MDAIGATTWVVAAAHIPQEQHQEPGRLPRRRGHSSDRACLLNTGADDAEVTVTLFFDGDTPTSPHQTSVAARSMRYLDFAKLNPPAPTGIDFCADLTSTSPIVVQHVRREVHGDNVISVSSPAYDGGHETS